MPVPDTIVSTGSLKKKPDSSLEGHIQLPREILSALRRSFKFMKPWRFLSKGTA